MFSPRNSVKLKKLHHRTPLDSLYKGHLSLGTLQTQITLLKHPQGPFDNTALTFIQVLNLH